jgi:DnaJ family protein C protein 27
VVSDTSIFTTVCTVPVSIGVAGTSAMGVVEVPSVSPAARLKIISLGEPTVGKSCLIKRFCEDKFVSKHVATIGIDFGVKPVQIAGAGDVHINFFDFAGGPEFFEIRNEFYRDAQGALLVFDVGSKATLAALDKWLREGQEFGMHTPALVLCGNKSDSKKREVSEEEAKRWASAHGAMPYFETSAKEGTNVAPMFEKLFQDACKAGYPGR